MNRDIKILAVFFLAVWLWGIGTVCCYGSTEKGQDKEQNTDQTDPEAAEGMLEEIEFGEIQKMVDELLGEQSFSLERSSYKYDKRGGTHFKRSRTGSSVQLLFFRTEK